MKRILIMGNSIAVGGAQKQQFLLKERLEKDGFEVDFCFVYIKNQSDRFGWIPSNKGRALKIQHQFYHPYYDYNPLWPVKSKLGYVYRKILAFLRFRSFRRFILEGNYDWIIPFSPTMAHMAIHTLSRLQMDTNVFFNLRGGEIKDMHKGFIRDFQSLGGRAHLLTNANFSLELLKERLRTERGMVLKNLIGFHSSTHNSKASDTDLIHVANYYPEKDFETLFGALKTLKQQYPNICLHLFCMFRMEIHYQEMQALIEQYGVSNNIQLYYQNEDKTPILSKATLGILATNSEGCSNSILEYLSHGLPVVTSAIPANIELLGPAYKNHMYEKGNAVDLADKIDLLLGDTALRTQLINSAKKILESYLEQSNKHYDAFKTYILSH